MLQGYELIELLGGNRSTRLCRARRVHDQRVVLLRLLELKRPTPEQVAGLRREYDLLESLSLPEIPRPLSLVTQGPEPAIVLEDRRGEILERQLKTRFPLARGLQLGVQLAHALAGLHAARLVHHDLRPANLLVDGDGRVSFVSLSRTSHRPARQAEEGVPGDELVYVSPEETERVDSPLDERSDLYSLGVVLYRVFSALLPFQAADPLEWAHAHRARTPAPLSAVVPELPQLVSDIVMKLLSKQPEARYQSARGLETDLARCLEALKSTGKIEPFALAQHDFTDRAETPGPRSLLANQAAISLENAELYADLRRENAERRQAEAALTKSKALLQAIIDSAPAAICVKDREGRYLLVNEYFARAMGTDRAGLVGKRDTDLFGPEEAALIHDADLRVLAAGHPIELEEDVRLQDGLVHTFLAIKAPLTDLNGEVFGVCGVETDITARKEAESVLRQTEQQLRQAQKMEAVGNLAGGIAHDFNNLLSIILSYSNLLARDLGPNDPRRADLQEIEAAGQRAAELTRQLLAFGRKQVLQPSIVNLNDTLRGLERMLRRLIGEDIELTLTTDPALGRTRVDPGQLEQIIMNLSVNSRDAMPRGGRLTLETSNVELDEAYAREHPGTSAGPHVMLAVTDTGVGMDQATQARIFEPFFTTKPSGKGTGLGLSTVFGIVQQSGGSIWVYSERDVGTCFKIYFPRVDAPAPEMEPPAPARPLRGTETVLLVEDDERVRTLARTILQRSGYRVLEAQNGAAALELCETNPEAFQLLLTDVVMPGMSGPELAERLRPLRPDARVLFMSGYPGDAISHHGVLDAGLAFIQKPITPESLTRKVREVLDAPTR